MNTLIKDSANRNSRALGDAQAQVEYLECTRSSWKKYGGAFSGLCGGIAAIVVAGAAGYFLGTELRSENVDNFEDAQ